MGGVALVSRDFLIYRGVTRTDKAGYTIGLADLGSRSQLTLLKNIYRGNIVGGVSFGTGECR